MVCHKARFSASSRIQKATSGLEPFYNDPSDIHSISSNWIFDIAEDQNGFLWIGTKSGLNKYDKRMEHF